MAQTGFADYQRTVNWDGPVLLEKQGENLAGAHTFGKFDVSKYGYLGGKIRVEKRPVQMTLLWRASKEPGALILGERQITLDHNITQFGQLRIPHQGPWLEILMNAEGGAEFTLTTALFNTNRYSAAEWLPIQPVLANSNPNVEPKGGQKDIWPSYYWAGPIRLKVFSPSSNWTVWIQAESGLSNFVIHEVLSGGANINTFVTTIVPMTAWKFTAINSSEAAATISCIAIPAMTGAT